MMWSILTGWQSTVHLLPSCRPHKIFPLIGPLGSFSVYSMHKGGSIAEEEVNQSAVCHGVQVVCHEDESMINHVQLEQTSLTAF